MIKNKIEKILSKIKSREYKKIIIGILVIICISIIVINNNTTTRNINEVNNENITKKDDDANEKKHIENYIYVHIEGAIAKPGIYKIAENERLNSLIEKSGGLTESADLKYINLAKKLDDAEKIYIPSKTDTLNLQTDTITPYNPEILPDNNKDNKININLDSKEKLQTIPGIGESTANKIIQYREKNNKFKSIDEIKNVEGIGENKFEKIKNYIKI